MPTKAEKVDGIAKIPAACASTRFLIGSGLKVGMGPRAFSTAVLSLSVIWTDFNSNTVPKRGAAMAAACRRCTNWNSTGNTRITVGLAH